MFARKLFLTVLVVGLLVAAGPVSAGVFNGTGDWTNAANWGGSVPPATDGDDIRATAP